MRPIQLKPRLAAIAALIPSAARVADIGTDHARIPIYLLQQGRCETVIATDIREGPLTMAAASLIKHRLEDKVALRLGPGATPLKPEEIDCAVVAGMGGDTIVEILEESPWLLEKTLILQPQTHPERVIGYLEGHGKTPVRSMASEERRDYTILFVKGEVL